MERKIYIDKIFDRYFSEPICKFVVVARVKVNGVYRFERLFFDEKKEMEQVREGLCFPGKYPKYNPTKETNSITI